MGSERHISANQLLTFELCGEAYRRRYIERERMPRNADMLRGTAVHRARRHALERRLESGELPDVAEVRDVTATISDEEFLGGEVVVPEGVGLGALRATLKDSSIRLAVCDREILQPGIVPEAIERRTVVELPGLPPIVAYSDVDDVENAVHEFKTGGPGSRFDRDAADRSEQITVYCLSLAHTKALSRVRAYLEKVRDLASGPKAEAQTTQRTIEDFQAILNRFAKMVRCIEAGIFPPASSQLSWKCQPAYCEYWAGCPYVTHPVSVRMEEGDNGR